MAQAIKGITVEIGGDTTKLGKALTDVNNSSKKLQSELNGVNSLLKMDPGNVTLIKQKQDLLNESIAQTKEKLNVLKSTQAQVQTQFDKGEITNEQYRDFQREIVATETKLKSLTTEAKTFGNTTTQAIKQAGEKISNFGDNLTNAGKKLSPLSVGMGALATTAVVSMDAVDEGLDTVVKKTGATGDTFNDLSDVFYDVAKSIPLDDFKEAGEAVGEINTRLEFTGEQLKTASEDFLKFAKVNDIDVNSAVQLVTRAMGDAGIEAGQYKGLLDTLTKAAQMSGISIDTLTTNLAQYGAPMRALGFDTNEAIAIFSQWEKAGVNTSTAFSGMKKAISNWSAEGKDAKVEFGKMLEEIKACPDLASATTKSIEVFGTKAGPDLADAIQGGRFEYENFLTTLQDSEGVLESTYGGIVDEVDDTKLAQQTLQVAMHDLGEMISKILGPILLGLSQKIASIFEWFNGLDSSIQKIILVIGGFIFALGPVLIVLGTLAGSVGNIIGLFAQLGASSVGTSGALSGLGGVLTGLSVPILAVIATIGAIIGAVIQLWNTSEGFRASVESAISNIMTIFNLLWIECLEPIFITLMGVLENVWVNGIQPLWTHWVQFVDTVTQKMSELLNNLMPFITWFIETFGPIITGIITVVSNTIGNFVTTTLRFFGTWFDTIGEVISGVVQIFSGIIDFITGIFTGDWDKAWNGVKDIFSGIFNTFESIAKAPINGVIWLINSAIGGINGLIDGINSISFDAPSWLGGGHIGFDFDHIGEIPYLAKGGVLKEGQAIVAEAGPELLQMINGRTVVTPLTQTSINTPANEVLQPRSGETTYNFTLNCPTPINPAEVNRQFKNMMKRYKLIKN